MRTDELHLLCSGADDYEPEFTDSGPLVEIGESVLHLGAKPHQNNTGVDPQRTHVKGPLGAKKPRRVSEGSQQRLLSQVPVDEDGKATGRRKIQIEYIQDRSRRHITFSKRKAGIMKKVKYTSHPLGQSNRADRNLICRPMNSPH